jgi:hypothetical protein
MQMAQRVTQLDSPLQRYGFGDRLLSFVKHHLESGAIDQVHDHEVATALREDAVYSYEIGVIKLAQLLDQPAQTPSRAFCLERIQQGCPGQLLDDTAGLRLPVQCPVDVTNPTLGQGVLYAVLVENLRGTEQIDEG